MNTLGTSWGNVAFEQREGNAPVLVFLHGTGCDSADWEDVIRTLPTDIATLTVDFRGHGGSSVPDEDFEFNDLVLDTSLVLELLNVERPIVVGHSLGGMVGIALSEIRQLCGLISLEGWTRLSTVRDAYERGRRFGQLDEEAIGAIDRKRDETQSRFSGDQWRGFWHTVQEFDSEEIQRRTDLRIWNVFGTQSICDDARTKLCIPDRTNIEMVWLNDCGHYLPHEVPERIAEICASVHNELK